MMQKACVVVIIFIAVFAWASKNSIAEVDAVSQATIHNNIKFVTPLAVGSDSAVIKWTDAKNRSRSGNVVLSYGPSETSMTDRAVTKAEATGLSFTLKGLTPNTTYKIKLQVSQTPATHAPCADTATIKTLATTPVSRSYTFKKDVPLELLDHSVRLGSAVKDGDHLTVTDCKGRTLLNHNVKSNEKVVDLPSNAKGVYFLIYSRQGTVLDKKQFVITHK
jgi:hypothetical protein